MTLAREGETALILGNYRTTLTVAQRLKEAGFQVIVSEADDGAAGARYSRYVADMWEHPELDESDGEPFRRALANLLARRPEITTVFPVEEKFVIWLARNSDALPHDVTLVSPSSDLVELCLDKTKMLELAKRAGVACAPFATVKTLKDLHRQCERIGFPVIIRPFSHLNRLGHKKAVICEDAEALSAMFPKWPADQPGLLLQRYVTGVRHDLYFIAVDGEIQSLLETRITRTDHPDGTGLSTEGVHIPITDRFREDTRKLVEATGYTGVGFVQFIRDPKTGDATFLELNPRTAGSHRCAEAVGMPLTLSALYLALGREDLSLNRSHRYPTGHYYAWFSGDLYGIKEAVGHREIGPAAAMAWFAVAMRSLIRARIHLTFSWRDPKPAVALLTRQVARIFAAKLAGHTERFKRYDTQKA